jgi:arylsulfatase A-like enzyme
MFLLEYVPLIVRTPGGITPGSVVSELVQVFDIVLSIYAGVSGYQSNASSFWKTFSTAALWGEQG